MTFNLGKKPKKNLPQMKIWVKERDFGSQEK